MLRNYLNKIPFLILPFLCLFSLAQTKVKIDATCQHFIGGTSQLERSKFFSIHDNGSDPDQLAFRKKYHVSGGRYFYGPFTYAKNKTGSVGVYPPDKSEDNALRRVNKGVATEHPANAFKDGIDIKAAAKWSVEYFKDYANERPEYFEVMNEPFVHAKDFYSGGWSSSENDRIKLQMAKLYNEVGKKFKETPALGNMRVIGYSAAWPSMELNDFGHWNESMKMFMDIAGANMYGFSTHLYDGINVEGQDNKRSGSNSEAILDLIENYSYIKWGKVKPHAITEYGAIEKGYGDDYSKIASAQTLRSINNILFNLLDRQDRMVVSIPFITGKAKWHINAANNYQPYGAVLWIPSNIGEPNPRGWHYSPRIHFYELWQDVKGERAMIHSDNPDIQVQAFVDGNKMYVALNNLAENNQTLNLKMLSDISGLEQVKSKSLKIYDHTMPDYSVQTASDGPSSMTLIKDETIVLEYTFDAPIVFDNALRTQEYYPKNYLEPIIANSPISYTFNSVATGDGYATLRMSIGRKQAMSKQPVVKVNGTKVEVPNNWAGYDQANRDDFFGMIEIPFPVRLLQSDNTVIVEFPDTGGRISSLILKVDKFDKAKTALKVGSVINPCPEANKGIITINPIEPSSCQVDITGEDVDENDAFSSSKIIAQL